MMKYDSLLNDCIFCVSGAKTTGELSLNIKLNLKIVHLNFFNFMFIFFIILFNSKMPKEIRKKKREKKVFWICQNT